MADEPTIESLQKQVADLQAEKATQDKTITDLRQEAADRRIAARDQQVRAHVLGHVVKSHNISFDAATYDYSKHGLEDGKVTGDVDYTPTAPRGGGGQNQGGDGTGGGGGSGLTMDDVKKMSRFEIKERWDDVSKVLDASAA